MNPQFAPDELLNKKLNPLRTQIAGLQQRKDLVNRALATDAEIMAEIDKDLRATESRYATMQQIGTFVAPAGGHHQPTLPCAAGDPGATPHDFWGVLRVILGDEAIKQGIERFLASRQGQRMSRDERMAALGRLDSEIRDLEIQEEREILRLEEQRFTVLRRADVNAQTLLEVWAAYKPEPVRKVPAKPLGLPKPKGLNDGASSVHAPVFGKE